MPGLHRDRPDGDQLTFGGLHLAGAEVGVVGVRVRRLDALPGDPDVAGVPRREVAEDPPVGGHGERGRGVEAGVLEPLQWWGQGLRAVHRVLQECGGGERLGDHVEGLVGGPAATARLGVPDAERFLVQVLAGAPGVGGPDVLDEVLLAAGEVARGAPGDLRRPGALGPVVAQPLGLAGVGDPPGGVVGAGGLVLLGQAISTSSSTAAFKESGGSSLSWLYRPRSLRLAAALASAGAEMPLAHPPGPPPQRGRRCG